MYAVLATTLCLLYYLLDIIGAGMILPAATCELRMDTIKKGIFTSAPFLGLVLTSHLWGFLTDWFGRQRIIVFSLWSALFFYIVAALVPNFWVGIISAALFNFLPESPKWLEMRGRTEQAFEVLQYIHQKNCNGNMAFSRPGQ